MIALTTSAPAEDRERRRRGIITSMSSFPTVPGPAAWRPGASGRPLPSWAGPPPERWLPGVAPLSLVLGMTDAAAVAVTGVAAYPTGFEVSLWLLSRYGGESGPSLVAARFGAPGAPSFGIAYADGRQAVLGDRWGAVAGDPQALTVFPHGWAGSERSRQHVLWVAPLPPAGLVRVRCAWPGLGPEELTAEFDAGTVLAAAGAARELWPEEAAPQEVADFAGAPPLPPPGVQPADPQEARSAVRRAFESAFRGGGRAEDAVAAVEDGAAVIGALLQVRAAQPVVSATSQASVGDIVFIDPVRAAVVFRIDWAQAPTFGAQLGYAVHTGGGWKVARDTYGRVLGWAGVALPPPPPSR